MQVIHPHGARESLQQLSCNTCTMMSSQNYLEGSLEHRYQSNILLLRPVWGLGLHSPGITLQFVFLQMMRYKYSQHAT